MITYNAPVVQQSLTRERLVAFSANIIERRIVCLFEVGYQSAGAFVKVSDIQRVFSDNTTPTFANFLQACPAAQQLRQQTEQFETTLNVPGTVD